MYKKDTKITAEDLAAVFSVFYRFALICFSSYLVLPFFFCVQLTSFRIIANEKYTLSQADVMSREFIESLFEKHNKARETPEEPGPFPVSWTSLEPHVDSIYSFCHTLLGSEEPWTFIV
jgi:hypothetical protein